MSHSLNLQPTLENDVLRIQPLQESDYERLYAVASDPAIWEQHPAKERSTREGFAGFFAKAIESRAAFLIVDKANDEVIGTSRYKLSDESAKAIEIGWTFLAKKYWGGAYNRAIKKLMIDYAFTQFENVLFYIHETNWRSQKAVEKLGAERVLEIEGVPLVPTPTASVFYLLRKDDWNRQSSAVR